MRTLRRGSKRSADGRGSFWRRGAAAGSAAVGVAIAAVGPFSVPGEGPIAVASAAHFAIYAGFGAVLCWGFTDASRQRPVGTLFALAVAAASVEVVRAALSSRDVHLADAAMAVMGSALGAAPVLLALKKPGRGVPVKPIERMAGDWWRWGGED